MDNCNVHAFFLKWAK